MQKINTPLVSQGVGGSGMNPFKQVKQPKPHESTSWAKKDWE